jgi:mycofactocin precursor peptide peptidase
VFELGGASWPEAAARAHRAVVVPLGSLEQHGPHLPLDTDTRIAVAVAAGIAADRDGVGVAPLLAFGASGEHAGFPGTLSIGTAALTELLVELGRDANRLWAHSPDPPLPRHPPLPPHPCHPPLPRHLPVPPHPPHPPALLLVNAHGGNQDAISAALARLGREGRRCAVFHAVPRSGDAHAGRTETAILLHLAPTLVQLELAEPGERRPIGELMARLRKDGVRSVSPNGVLGDPRGATAAEGRRLLEEIVAAGNAALDQLLALVAAHD